MKLPLNENIKQNILKINQPWENILKGTFHKKLYCFNIIEELSISKDSCEWQEEFLKSEGLNFLILDFIKLDMNIIKSALTKKFVHKLLLIINYFLQKIQVNFEDIFQTNCQNIQQKCIEKALECIFKICSYCLLREN